MVNVFFRKNHSKRKGIIGQRYYHNSEQIEHIIAETYCYGLDNFDSEPPKYILVIGNHNRRPIYEGKIVIPEDEDDKLYLEPHLSTDQINNITRRNFVIVKEIPDELGAFTDEEDESIGGGGGKKNKKTSKQKMSKRKTSKQKNSKQKMSKRKTSKRKTSKRKTSINKYNII
jgi:hypothetical protein